jgi:hypothetical protein
MVLEHYSRGAHHTSPNRMQLAAEAVVYMEVCYLVSRHSVLVEMSQSAGGQAQ